MLMRKFLLSFALILSLSSEAKMFTSEFTEFQLPSGWECALEGSEWVCQSTNTDRKREAIIILAAKLRGDEDTLSAYQTYLKNSRAFNLPGGKKQVSEPKYTNAKDISGHQWIDSLHLASEVPGFYTRYLATVKGDLGVLVTFSVSKDHYQAYQKVIDKIVESLKVFAQMKKTGTQLVKKGSGDSLPGEGAFVGSENDLLDISVSGKQKQKDNSGGGAADMLMYIIGAAAVGFAVMKMKKGKGKGAKKVAKKKVKKKKEDA
ncbi:hypothetical protein M899_1706 [Bacteriovorax sp. BSW11_IV]|nr:hypothetical protein M899_1706 [Bacteriovorax sp. BSW11_IV]